MLSHHKKHQQTVQYLAANSMCRRCCIVIATNLETERRKFPLMAVHLNRNHTGTGLVSAWGNNDRTFYFDSPIGATSQLGESITSSKSAKKLRIIVFFNTDLCIPCPGPGGLRRPNELTVTKRVLSLTQSNG